MKENMRSVTMWCTLFVCIAGMTVDMIVLLINTEIPMWVMVFNICICFAISSCVLLGYILKENDDIFEKRSKRSVNIENMTVNMLTGLQDEESFNVTCKALRRCHDVGVAYCNLNLLKYINSREGRTAGDQYIRAFAEQLLVHFRFENLFHIGGDNFVILMPDIAESIYKERIKKFREILSEDKLVKAAVGDTFGDGRKLNDLVSDARTEMLSEKKKIYKSFPEFCRKKENMA